MNFEHLCINCMMDKGNNNVCPYCGFDISSYNLIASELLPYSILNGRYLIGKVIGYGIFGTTYLSYDINLRIKAAIKEYFPRDFAFRDKDNISVCCFSPEAKDKYDYGIDKFLQEARTLAKFQQNPCIVNIKDFFRENNTAYYVMNYVDGITLRDYLAQINNKRLDFALAYRVMLPVMDALKEIHKQGLLHRDICPENIYITRKKQIKLLEFGAARYMLGDKSRNLSVILRPGYAPEEQYRSSGKQEPFTDIYSLAAVLYEIITGIKPQEALERMEEDKLIPPSEMNIAIPEKSEKAILKALSIKGKDRYQTIEEFQREII